MTWRESDGPEATRRLAAAFARSLRGGDVVLLQGNLGMGKTCFAQGVLEGLGWTGAVNSPTFSLVQEYETEPPLAHLDLYRLKTAEEVWSLGLEELFESGCVLLVEWSERAAEVWPADAWRIRLEDVEGNAFARRICCERQGRAAWPF